MAKGRQARRSRDRARNGTVAPRETTSATASPPQRKRDQEPKSSRTLPRLRTRIVGALAVLAAVVTIVGVDVADVVEKVVPAAKSSATSTTSSATPATNAPPAESRVPSVAPVRMESLFQVANVTRGDTSYADTVTAEVDDVLKFQVWYYNMEDVDSGQYAAQVDIQVSLPETFGEQLTTRVAITGQNIETMNGEAAVTVPDGSVLEYIEGTTKWRHPRDQNATSIEYITEPLLDGITASGVRVGDVAPCLRCEATVTILVRVIT